MIISNIIHNDDSTFPFKTSKETFNLAEENPKVLEKYIRNNPEKILALFSFEDFLSFDEKYETLAQKLFKSETEKKLFLNQKLSFFSHNPVQAKEMAVRLMELPIDKDLQLGKENDDTEDEALQMALALSLKHTDSVIDMEHPGSSTKTTEEEEDADLALAISLSLEDSHPKSSTHQIQMVINPYFKTNRDLMTKDDDDLLAYADANSPQSIELKQKLFKFWPSHFAVDSQKSSAEEPFVEEVLEKQAIPLGKQEMVEEETIESNQENLNNTNRVGANRK